MGLLEPWHIVVFVVILFVMFGAKKLPDATRSAGQSLRIFKSEMRKAVDEGAEAKAGDAQKAKKSAETQA
jgi:sec-independent protein translocase protein TatA